MIKIVGLAILLICGMGAGWNNQPTAIVIQPVVVNQTYQVVRYVSVPVTELVVVPVTVYYAVPTTTQYVYQTEPRYNWCLWKQYRH